MLLSVLTFLTWTFLIVCAVILFFVLSVAMFLNLAPTFGGKPDAISQQRIKDSPNFNGREFVNLQPTQAATIKINTIKINTIDGINKRESNDKQDKSKNNSSGKNSNSADESGLIKNFLFPPKGKNPQTPIITQSLNFTTTPLNDGELVWLGHSTVMFCTAGKTLITDPVFHRASPLAIGGKPFAMTHTPQVQHLPFIDIVLISHDHYDHLDHKTIKQMKHKVGHFYVPLGVKAHLVRWGVVDSQISEYDWYDEVTVGEIRLVFAPTRHFSGRGLFNHRTTLWGSWVVKSPNLSVYFSGDGGYSAEFAKIGERFGGFDIAFIEDGAYNLRWREVHMMPEESAQAGIDVKAKVVLPIHWGKFDLSTHQWAEPVNRIKTAMDEHNASLSVHQHIQIATPRIGEVFTIYSIPKEEWWL